MQLTLNSLSALHILRSIRTGEIGADLGKRCSCKAPDKGGRSRWSRKMLAAGLASVGAAGLLDGRRQLYVLVPQATQRLQLGFVHNTVCSEGLPENSFVDLGNGVATSCPELLFIELGRVMDPIVHLLLGIELCGCFSRSPIDPRNGSVRYGLEPATSVSKLRSYAQKARGIWGAERALETIDLIAENAWSPMEAVLAALLVLPTDQLGFDLGPIRLNPRKELGERLSRLSEASSRVPDIMFTGTDVGLNYDGEDHFRLSEIADAAVALDRDPGNFARQRELAQALAEARSRIVEDKRRDRDLMSLGLTVFSVTKEDLLEKGSIERVVGQVVEAIERTERRDLSAQRIILCHDRLVEARWKMIRALLPGSAHLEGPEQRQTISMDDAIVGFELDEHGLRIVSVVK